VPLRALTSDVTSPGECKDLNSILAGNLSVFVRGRPETHDTQPLGAAYFAVGSKSNPIGAEQRRALDVRELVGKRYACGAVVNSAYPSSTSWP
jgi:hypothetical protein